MTSYSRLTVLDGRLVIVERVPIETLPEFKARHNLADDPVGALHDPAGPAPWQPAVLYAKKERPSS